MVAGLAVAMALGLHLEGAVLNVEVALEAFAELIEDLAAGAVGHGGVGYDDVRGQDRYSAGDGPGVEVVDVGNPGNGEDVVANVVEVEPRSTKSKPRRSSTPGWELHIIRD